MVLFYVLKFDFKMLIYEVINMKLIVLIFYLTAAACISDRLSQCGYESCTKLHPSKINVHIVPHTHDDAGWLKTFDQYYYGSKSEIQKAGVQYILDSVTDELSKDREKRFIYAESSFFFKWWNEQTVDKQKEVRKLVDEGRLQFAGGAWSMNDEAVTHYQSIIDQFTLGLRKLNDTFGACGRPRIAWQIDPFGHSREMASMFAQMAYDGLFFGRLDEEDFSHRTYNKTMEMIWKASSDLGESSNLFTGVLFNLYQPPPGFCFDIQCDDVLVTDAESHEENNMDWKAEKFIGYVQYQAINYRTKNLIITMGGDFSFMQAQFQYGNLDKLIKFVNQQTDSNLNLFYSTPLCYLKALHDTNRTWPIKTEDFFPYGSNHGTNEYWTGYFTSRTTLKRFERIGNHFLQVSKQLAVLNPIKPKNQGEVHKHLDFLRETMGIMQHHDAVTGTEKQHVADDYAKRIYIGLEACEKSTKEFLRNLITPSTNNHRILHDDNFDDSNHTDAHDRTSESDFNFEFKNCLLLNISTCEVSETSDRFILTLFNPLSSTTNEYIRVPVPSAQYHILDYRNETTPYQIVPTPSSIKKLSFREAHTDSELVFMAHQVPPMGYTSYYITQTALQNQPQLVRKSETFKIKKKYLTLEFANSGHLSRVSGNGVNIALTQDYFYYKSFGNKLLSESASGAYIFNPAGDAEKVTERVEVYVIGGPLVQEVHQTFGDYVSQVIRLYAEEKHVEFEWLVGPIPVEEETGIGREIVSRFDSDIRSNQTFYTDSNGRQTMKRVRSCHETWNPDIKKTVSANYYPVVSKIALEDGQARMAVLVDRPQGGSSVRDGSLELMIHRRLLVDDGLGVDEPLNETAYNNGLISRGKHYLMFGSSQTKARPTAKAQEKFLQIKKHTPLWPFFDNAMEIKYDQFKDNYYPYFTGMSMSLPPNVHVLSFEEWHDGEILVRFEHIMESGDDAVYSKEVTFNFKDVFKYLPVESIAETTLDGSMWLQDKVRLQFREDSNGRNLTDNSLNEELLRKKHKNYDEDKDPFEITLIPQQIRTFILRRSGTFIEN